MRPFLPQSKVNFPVLLKLVVIYGVVALIVLLCVVVVAFVVVEGNGYWSYYNRFGIKGIFDELSRDFLGLDSKFIRLISRSPLLTLFAPFGAGGILGVFHYIFVRKRRSIIQTIDESLELEVDSK